MKINKDILKNTVKAENQVKLNQTFLGDLKNPNAFRIMYIGNSITLHEVKPDIGWYFNHGMAASKPENDYVHITNELIEKFLKKPVSSLVYNAADFERQYNIPIMSLKLIEQAKKFKPEIIFIRIGENVYKDNLDINAVKLAFKNLIAELSKICKRIIITSLFWYFEPIDLMLEELANEFKYEYVYIADLGYKKRYQAIGKFEHVGIQHHPGDQGMKKIAKRIFKQFKKEQ